jgi:hypothetical protein
VGRLLGSALEARILLCVGNEALRQRLAALVAASNKADPLRYAFIVSQVQRNVWCPCAAFGCGVHLADLVCNTPEGCVVGQSG